MTHTRRNFPNPVKREAWERSKDESGVARCDNCTARLSVGNVHYDERTDGEFDHAQSDAMLGDPTLENCQVLCRSCHGRKTKRDRKIIAKSNHVRDRARGIKTRSLRQLPGNRDSNIKLRFNAPPIDRRTGEPWGRR